MARRKGQRTQITAADVLAEFPQDPLERCVCALCEPTLDPAERDRLRARWDQHNRKRVARARESGISPLDLIFVAGEAKTP